MSKRHAVIIVPGLGDNVNTIQIATNHWRKSGLEIIVHSVGWRNGEKEFKPKLDLLEVLIDKLVNKGNFVSLVGTSAGGSAVLNAYIERKKVLNKIIIICSRLRVGSQHGFRSFEKRTASSRVFAQSIMLSEAREKSLSLADRKRIMTVRAQFGDELVPIDTAILKDAKNTTIPTIEHVFSIGAALTVFSKPLIEFLISHD
jgi:hypothetical protein